MNLDLLLESMTEVPHLLSRDEKLERRPKPHGLPQPPMRPVTRIRFAAPIMRRLAAERFGEAS